MGTAWIGKIRIAAGFISGLSLILIFLASAGKGTVVLGNQEFFTALFSPHENSLASRLVWEIRIPRFVAAILCGGSLALCGQLLQLLVRNPLADPYTLGTGSGAALGLQLSVLGFLPPYLSGIFFMPFWAFAGALCSGLLVLSISGRIRNASGERLILGGIAISILANSASSFMSYFVAGNNEIRQMVFWAFGSLEKASWPLLIPISAIILPGIILSLSGSRLWNLMLLGEEKIQSLGKNPEQIKRILLLLTAYLTACVVCLAGPIGFVGLVVPFCVRQLVPLGQKGQLAITFFAGAFFLSFCDLLPRLLPFGILPPTGLITSLAGLPLFLYLLHKSAKREA